MQPSSVLHRQKYLQWDFKIHLNDPKRSVFSEKNWSINKHFEVLMLNFSRNKIPQKTCTLKMN